MEKVFKDVMWVIGFSLIMGFGSMVLFYTIALIYQIYWG